MRSSARARRDVAALLPIVGTSLMMVVAASHGLDEADAVPARDQLTTVH